MSGVYTCVSCRYLLLRHKQHSYDPTWLQRASFVTFGNGIGQPSSEAPNPEGEPSEPRIRKQIYAGKSNAADYDSRQKQWSLEDEFLQRLFESRRAPGPYSKTSPPRQWTRQRDDDEVSLIADIQVRGAEQVPADPSYKGNPTTFVDSGGNNSVSATPENVGLRIGPRSLDAQLPTQNVANIQSQLEALQTQINNILSLPSDSKRQPNHQIPQESERSSLLRDASDAASEQSPLFKIRPYVVESMSSTKDLITYGLHMEEHNGPRPGKSNAYGLARLRLKNRGATDISSRSKSTPLTLARRQALFNKRERSATADSLKTSESSDLTQSAEKQKPHAHTKSTRISDTDDSSYSPLEELSKFKRQVLMPSLSGADSWEAIRSRWGRDDKPGLDRRKIRASFPKEGDFTGSTALTEWSRLLRSVVRKTTQAWCRAEDIDRLPKPTEILKELSKATTTRDHLWRPALWVLLPRIISMTITDQTVHNERSQRDLLDEIIQTWVMIRNTYAADTRQKETSWESLGESMFSQGRKMQHDYETRFAQAFPGFSGMPRAITMAGLATFIVLHKYTECPNGERFPHSEGQSLMVFFAKLISKSSLVNGLDSTRQAMGAHLSWEYNSDFNDRLTNVERNAISVTPQFKHQLIAKASTRSPTSRDPRTALGEILKRRIAVALESRNISRVEDLLRQAQATFPTAKTGGGCQGIPPNVYAHFFRTFMALGRPNRAIDLWNQMIAEGKTATVATWSAMIKGAAIAKDPNGIETLWEKMIMSGLQPDGQAWSERIHGLGANGQWRQSLIAFRDMTNHWTRAVSRKYPEQKDLSLSSLRDIDGIPKPETRTINSLLYALARASRSGEIVDAISLANMLGIKPDMYTTNSVINAATKVDDPKVKEVLVQQIQHWGVNPDIATFTIMLNALYKGDATSDQVLSVRGILADMETYGLEPNQYTFSTLISGLLKSHQNSAAAYEVTQFMSQHNVPLSSQIYTSFATYHFDQEPPELETLERLWLRALVDRNVRLDNFFFNRMIEGYARSMAINKMTTALVAAAKRGYTTGWVALTEVIKAFARNGNGERVAEVVANVRREDETRQNMRAKDGQWQFWRVVESLGFGGENDTKAKSDERQVEESRLHEVAVAAS